MLYFARLRIRKIDLFAMMAAVLCVFAATATFAAGGKKNNPDFVDSGCDIEFARLGRKPILTQRTELIADYLDHQFTTVAQNEAWIKVAKNADSKSNVLFGDVEFSVLGDINRITNDKNLATSLANKHKELTFERLEALRKRMIEKYPDTVEEIIFYSDFKSVRFAVIPKPKPLSLIRTRKDRFHELPLELKEDVAMMFKGINDEYSEFVKANSFNVDGKVENWFRGGTGATADEANFAARTSRDMGGPNLLQDFENPRIQKALDVYKNWGESMRVVDILPDPAMKPLLDGEFLKDDVLDIVKKTPNFGEARSRLKAKYGAELNEHQIERIQAYNDIIDKFSVGIHVAERKVASLEQAEIGGLSADFSGLSAKNRGATARALAKAKGLRDAIALARKGEAEVTRDFEKSMKEFKKAVGKYLADSVSSGDDFVGLAKTRWTKKSKTDLINDLAKLENPSGQRIAFISNGVEMSQRNLLAAHGEAIEKVLRQQLEGKIPTDKLKRVIFGIDMGGKSIGTGDVQLMTGVADDAGLTKADRAEIGAAFKRAIEAFNQKVDKDVPTKNYVAK